MSEPRELEITVLVLGDIGRSPRMQYHALSLCKSNKIVKVNLVGYVENDILNDLVTNPKLLVIPIGQAPKLSESNPPSVPTLVASQIICYFYNIKLIIDWHNFGFSILALKYGTNSLPVKIYRKIEHCFGKSAYAHLCVTKAMSEELIHNWDIKGKVVVLYDKPPSNFKRLPEDEIHEFFGRLSKDPSLSVLKALSHTKDEELETAITRAIDGKVEIKKDRPLFIVSSTSWTKDEDFSILLSALQDYEAHHSSSANNSARNSEIGPCKLIVIITGKGPYKDYYLEKIAEMKWNLIKIVTVWLKNEDYPLLLVLTSLSKMGEMDWFSDTSLALKRIEKMRNNLKDFKDLDWHTNWNENVLPLLK